MRFSSTFATASSLLVLLASCVGPPASAPAPTRAARARPVPAPRPTPTPSPTPTPASAAASATPVASSTAWADRPLTPGNWSYRAEQGGSIARFGPPAQPLLTLRCDLASRRIILTRYGAGQGAIVIRTSYGAVSWPATAQGGAQPALVAARAASDGVLDQMAYSRGKIGVDASGIAPLVVPVWAEIARVVEDCRA
ncbi:hypothetical protein LL253_18215 [Sphingobium soli]|uniref:DUF2511 domain-containing protein n=2 Tax=Sphingobium soli TaxID=1591116 RepID=A0ABS8H7U1_9SPHN|nr:hypothetical protein [Sphingobium soli]